MPEVQLFLFPGGSTWRHLGLQKTCLRPASEGSGMPVHRHKAQNPYISYSNV
jgi:hypothetical protein